MLYTMDMMNCRLTSAGRDYFYPSYRDEDLRLRRMKPLDAGPTAPERGSWVLYLSVSKAHVCHRVLSEGQKPHQLFSQKELV